MVKLWVNMLIAGKIKISDVPAKRLDAVKAELQTRVDNGSITSDIMKSILKG